MILPHNNRHLAQQYFETLPSSDVSRRYYEGEKYQTPTSFFGRLYNSLFIVSKLGTLNKFYPYQKTIKATIKQIESDIDEYTQNSLAFTALSWIAIYQLGRRGYVFPILKEYGSVLKTHRLFRHYLYTLIGPILYSIYALQSKYYTHVEHLWTVHANRMNQKLLDDPLYTYYPRELQDKRRNVSVPLIFRDDPR